MSTSDRSREIALLRLVGTTRRQVLRMLRLETLTAVVVAVALGTGISLVTLSAFSSGMTGSAVPYVPPLTYLAVVAAAAVLALAATAIPASIRTFSDRGQSDSRVLFSSHGNLQRFHEN
jgi:putative ABC transport system permease protein